MSVIGNDYSSVQAAADQRRRDAYVASQNSLNRLLGTFDNVRQQNNIDRQHKFNTDRADIDDKYRSDYFQYMKDQAFGADKKESVAATNAGPLLARQVYELEETRKKAAEKRQKFMADSAAVQEGIGRMVSTGKISLDPKTGAFVGAPGFEQLAGQANMEVLKQQELKQQIEDEFGLADEALSGTLSQAAQSGFMYDPQSRGLKYVKDGQFFRYQNPMQVDQAGKTNQRGRETAFGFARNMPPRMGMGDLRAAEQGMPMPEPVAPRFVPRAARAPRAEPSRAPVPQARPYPVFDHTFGSGRQVERPAVVTDQVIVQRLRKLISAGMTPEQAKAQLQREFNQN